MVIHWGSNIESADHNSSSQDVIDTLGFRLCNCGSYQGDLSFDTGQDGENLIVTIQARVSDHTWYSKEHSVEVINDTNNYAHTKVGPHPSCG